MQYTDGLLTALATFWFAATFLGGVYFAARCGSKTVLPSIVLAVVVSFVRFGLGFDPLSCVSILCMGGLHISAGIWLGLAFKPRKAAASAQE